MPAPFQAPLEVIPSDIPGVMGIACRQRQRPSRNNPAEALRRPSRAWSSCFKQGPSRCGDDGPSIRRPVAAPALRPQLAHPLFRDVSSPWFARRPGRRDGHGRFIFPSLAAGDSPVIV